MEYVAAPGTMEEFMAQDIKSTNGATKTRKTPAKKTTAKKPAKVIKVTETTDNKSEAKTRFNAALDEAKAGAAALKAEAGDRAGVYRVQAKEKTNDLVAEAKTYGSEAKVKAGELANEGKAKASGALSSLSKLVSDSAPQIDEKLGEQYGDYARKASQSLTEASVKLDAKSVDEIGEDAREMVRKSPGVAVGLAAVTGFLLARLFRGGK
jgi:ElaB/YqjD/DUF883 family membrane-anchored ribosome-binding protein